MMWVVIADDRLLFRGVREDAEAVANELNDVGATVAYCGPEN